MVLTENSRARFCRSENPAPTLSRPEFPLGGNLEASSSTPGNILLPRHSSLLADLVVREPSQSRAAQLPCRPSIGKRRGTLITAGLGTS